MNATFNTHAYKQTNKQTSSTKKKNMKSKSAFHRKTRIKKFQKGKKMN